MKIVKEIRQVSVNTIVVDGESFDLHPWARYVATDKDGEVWEYADEPEEIYDLYWHSYGMCDQVTSFETEKEDWAKSLIKVGEE